MSYVSALQAAGAEVKCSEYFGSYQGDWWALVVFNGVTGWVSGSYGSCSGCDAFESEFGYNDDQCKVHRYKLENDGCLDCVSAKLTYDTKLAAFGLSYLEAIMTQQQAEDTASQNISWDVDAAEMLKFIRDNSYQSLGDKSHENVLSQL